MKKIHLFFLSVAITAWVPAKLWAKKSSISHQSNKKGQKTTPQKPGLPEEMADSTQIKRSLETIKGQLELSKGEKVRYWTHEENQPYFTSPDFKVGAKLIIDPAHSGPTLSTLVRLTLLPGGKQESQGLDSSSIIYIIKGSVLLTLGGNPQVPLKEGGACLLPPRGAFQYYNNGQTVAEVLQFYSPAGPEVHFKQWKEAFKEK